MLPLPGLRFAYNPWIVKSSMFGADCDADRSFFPNQASFLNGLAQVGQVFPFTERRTLFRFTVGRTF